MLRAEHQECPGVKNYKLGLTWSGTGCSCIHVATVDVKELVNRGERQMINAVIVIQ